MNVRKLELGHGFNRKSDFLINMKMDRELGINGEITHSHSGQSQGFQSFLELVLLMQSKMDETGFPQSTHEVRTWENKLIPLAAGRFEAYEK